MVVAGAATAAAPPQHPPALGLAALLKVCAPPRTGAPPRARTRITLTYLLAYLLTCLLTYLLTRGVRARVQVNSSAAAWRLGGSAARRAEARRRRQGGDERERRGVRAGKGMVI